METLPLCTSPTRARVQDSACASHRRGLSWDLVPRREGFAFFFNVDQMSYLRLKIIIILLTYNSKTCLWSKRRVKKNTEQVTNSTICSGACMCLGRFVPTLASWHVPAVRFPSSSGFASAHAVEHQIFLRFLLQSLAMLRPRQSPSRLKKTAQADRRITGRAPR